jgi:hypothetical protein
MAWYTIARLLLAGVALGGCEPDPHELSWRAQFGLGVDATRAARIEARILSGGCDQTTEIFRSSIAPVGSWTARSVRLGPGAYGFELSATDPECVRYAVGCEDVTLPPSSAEPVLVTLGRAPSERRLCPVERCSNGACGIPPDATTAPPGDAGVDGCGVDDLSGSSVCPAGTHCAHGDDVAGVTTFACAPDGPGVQASLCSGPQDCAGGFGCFSVRGDGSEPRVCAAYCVGHADCPSAPGARCLDGGEYGYCSTACNPVINDVCPPGTKCELVGTDGITACRGLGTLGLGETCERLGDCVAGTTCVPMAGGRRCLRYCDAVTAPCPGGEPCLAFSAETTIGVCPP